MKNQRSASRSSLGASNVPKSQSVESNVDFKLTLANAGYSKKVADTICKLYEN
jgi:hypothetical protein